MIVKKLCEIRNASLKNQVRIRSLFSYLYTFRHDHVINYVEKPYLGESNNRLYFGFSLNGLLGVYILNISENTFNTDILRSPAFGGGAVFIGYHSK